MFPVTVICERASGLGGNGSVSHTSRIAKKLRTKQKIAIFEDAGDILVQIVAIEIQSLE
jgi:hypothetical protein